MRPTHRTCIVALAVLLAAMMAIPGCREKRQELKTYTDAAHEIWGFEGAVLVAYRDHIIFSKGYGLADHTFGDPNTTSTKFYIGSITKQFTAAAILLLEERGELSVDDPITKYLPVYPNDPGDRITIHHLLTHTSGIPNYTDIPEVLLRRTSPIPSAELIDLFKNLPLEFEPGSRFSYSNSGYVVLGAIIETVAGQSYEAFLQKEILKPVGMTNSGYGWREMRLPGQAEGYTHLELGEPARAAEIDLSVLHTAGALYSTADDMLKWHTELFRHHVLNHRLVAKMLTPHTSNYAYGWFVESRNDRYHTYHGGFLDGYNTTFSRWINDTVCVIVFSNDDTVPVKKMARGLSAIVFGEPYTMPLRKTAVSLPPEDLLKYRGVFELYSGLYRVVTVDGLQVYSFILGESPQLIHAAAPDTFFVANDNTISCLFTRDSTGAIAALETIDEGDTVSATRLGDQQANLIYPFYQSVKLDDASLDRLTGVYLLESALDESMASISIRVSRKGDHLIITTEESETVEVYPASVNEFFHDVADYRIIFTFDSRGNTIGCLLRMAGAYISGRKIE